MIISFIYTNEITRNLSAIKKFNKNKVSITIKRSLRVNEYIKYLFYF